MTMGDGSAPPDHPARTTAGVVRRHPAGLIAAVLSATAAVSATTGAFLPLFSAKQYLSGQTFVVTMTSLRMDVDGGRSLVGVPKNGYPLACAAILLACAAVVCWHAAKPAASPAVRRVAGVLTATGGAFLACAVWMVALQVSNWADIWGLAENSESFRSGAETSYLIGHWVLLAAAPLGVAAAVLALLADRRSAPLPVPAVDPDAPTPPYGIALPSQSAAEQVDPLTGHPVDSGTGDLPAEPSNPPVPAVLEPIVIPEAPQRQEPPPGPAVPPTEDPLAEPRRD